MTFPREIGNNGKPAQWVTPSSLGWLSGGKSLNSAVAPVRNLSARSSSSSPSIQQHIFSSLASLNAPVLQSGGGTTTVSFFGPQQYVRTTGPPNSYTTTVQVPAGVGNPFNLHIQNGEANGSNRVSSATITINNVSVAGPSDFNQNIFTLDRAVTLTPTTTLGVTLASKPGSYLRINLTGTNADHTPPVLTIAAPLTSSVINTPQAHIDIRYQDIPGSGESAASGVNITTLKVLLDGVDRTNLFTKRSDEATADVPASLALAQGSHTLTASIQDNAGNTGQARSQFQIDTTPPSLQILQPLAGVYLNTTTPQIQLAYGDDFAINTSSLKVIIDEVDRTSLFTKTNSGAIAGLSGASALPVGANKIVATISDQAGNQATASAAFNVDTTPPVISIVHPTPASRHGSSSVEFSIQYSDDQVLDLSTLQVAVDGTSLAVSPAATTASGSATLADGNHTLTASIKDRAGNQASTSSAFSVDTKAPDIHILQPVAGAILNNATPAIQVQFSDNDIDPSTLKVSIDGVDRTQLFTISGSSAVATSPALPDSSHTIAAQIRDLTGNLGQTSSSLLIDTIKPQITIVSPAGAIKNSMPGALAQYSDSGSGIDPASVHVLLDGVDVTGTFSVAAGSTTGVLGSGAGLSEGVHQLQVTVADRAGNVAQATSSFRVDITPPVAAFTSPANNSFINKTQPALTLTYSDSGSGIDPNSIHIFLQQGSGPESEITSQFTVQAGQASGTIPASSALSTGTYHLRAQVADQAGNVTTATSAFAVDITPPTYTIQSPAANAFFRTATPAFSVTYQDDSSGVDPSKFALRVDGIDQTSSVTAIETGASGTLPALADGKHQVEVTVVDRAGNSAPVVPQSFLVDTIPPTINITSPVSGIFTNNNRFPIAVSYADSGSGIDVTTLKVLIDGVDSTAGFTTTVSAATGAPAAPLADGPHSVTVTISDLAGNSATATTGFIVDTIPPQLTITQPADGGFTNAANTVVIGIVVDASPVTVTVEGTSVPVQGTSFTSAGITLNAGPIQVIHVVATDAAGNSTKAKVNVNIDRIPPTITGAITPVPTAAGWNNSNVTVSFVCADDSSGVASCSDPVTVSTEGAKQNVIGTAIDRAGNKAQVSVPVSIDKTPPVITATAAPPANAAGWNTTDVVVTFTCSDSLSGIATCPPPTTVSTQGKNQQVPGTATDNAGNSANTSIPLNIEKTGPTITGTVTPAPNAAGWNKSDVTVNFVCSPSASDIVTCQPSVTVSSEGKGQSISGSVNDQAGNTVTTSVTVNLDKTLPTITASSVPAPNAAGWNNTDVIVSYFCSDSLSGIAICPPPATVSMEGRGQNISAQAIDVAGNMASVNTPLNIDKTPPTITVSSAPPPNSASWNNSNVTVSYLCTDNLSGVAACPNPTVVATEGQNQSISAQATDVAGNVATGSINLSIDKTPPTIVQLSTPDHISRLHPGQITVTATDNFTVAQVVISVNGSPLGTFTTAPYQAALQTPAGANPGDTLTITAQATDQAGNTQTATRGVRVAADGVVVGQVLSDVTSFPIQGASVQAISKTSSSDQTDDHGRYSLQVSDSHLFLSVSGAAPPTTTVEREVFVQDNVGTVPVDARLTPLAAPLPVGAAGGTVTAGLVSIVVPASTVSDGTTFQVTPLSGQGLPGLLPLGWSPLAAFDLRASSPVANLSASAAKMPNVVAHLVTYNPALHAWTMVSPNLQPASGSFSFTVPAAGDYALVVADATTPPVAVPSSNNPLTGIDMQLLSSSAVSSGSLSPAILPPSGGTATATLGVQSPAFVPSGTVIQANVSEKFSLKSGDVVSQESRSEDIVLYNALAPANTTLGAQFPVSPSRKFANAELITGKVHLDILAGREGVRGQPGGSDPLTLSDGTATLSVPGGALSEDTAISVQSVATEDFVPTNGSMGALQEVLVDFSGETLNTPAQLSIPSTGLNPNHTFLLTTVERLDGVPRIVVVALAQINGGNLTSVASPGLPGITQGGQYVFYDFPSPIGFVTGVVSSTAGPVQAVVQTDSFPIVSITGANGVYLVPALVGIVNLKASAPHTALAGSATSQVLQGQNTPANIQLAGTVTAAVVSPADGSLGVPVSTVITITTTAPINPQSIQQSNLQLFKGPVSGNQLIPLQAFVLSTSGTVLSFAPQANLDPAVQYTIQVAGLADTFGGAISVPSSSFTTKAAAVFNFDPNQITFSFPDQNGNIHVSALAGALRPGTKVMIIDQSNGVVLSLTAFNDGSLSGDFPGTINDTLQITVTDPNGATTSYTRSQFVAADGSVAVGPGGGTVTGPGGIELRIPPGALDKGAVFQLESFGPDAFPERPDLDQAEFAGGIRVKTQGHVTIHKELKLAFPKPADAPDGSFYLVYRRLKDPSGNSAFEILDHAFVEGTGPDAKVVMASYPFIGYYFEGLSELVDFGVSGLLLVEDIKLAAELTEQIMMLLKPAVPLPGTITGKILRAVNPHTPGNPGNDVIFAPVPGSVVTGVRVSGNPLIKPDGSKITTATSGPDGAFTLIDRGYKGGSIDITATAADGPHETQTATATEVVILTDKNLEQLAGPLLRFYRNVAHADIVFPALAPPPPPPLVNIGVFTEVQTPDPANPGQTLTSLRDAGGVIVAGTPLVIGFQSNGALGSAPNVTLNGISLSVQPAAPAHAGKFEFELTDKFVPGGAGLYKIVVNGLTAFTQPITASKTFLVVGAGGNNNAIRVGEAPTVVSVSPASGSIGVPVDTFVQVAFSEPVTNIPGNISLVPADGSPAPQLRLSGINYKDGSIITALGPNDAVSSLTIQPTTGLKFGMQYALKFTQGIVDLDNTVDNTKPALALETPQPDNTFTTFGPQVLGGTQPFSSTRAVVIGDRAYLARAASVSVSEMDTYNISDPSHPAQVPTGTADFIGRAQDIAAEENAGVIGGGNLVAVAAGVGATAFGLPANIWLYNVSGDQAQRVGGVSATSSTVNVGQVLRLTLKGDFAYTSTFPLGMQIIDLNQGISDYNSVFKTNPAQFGTQITTDGQGFALDAVVNTIPVKDQDGRNVMLLGIQAGDFTVAGSDPQNPTVQTLVAATGFAPGVPGPAPLSFVVVDPASGILYSGQLQQGNGALTAGTALALGQLADSVTDASGNPVQIPVAIVVGRGTAPDPVNPGQVVAGGVLAVVDMSTPSAPQVIGLLHLDSFPTDVVLKDAIALVGTGENKVLLVNLFDPRNPVNAGSITNSIFGDRLALTKDGILLGTSPSGNNGGIQTATLGTFGKVTSNPTILLADKDSKSIDDLKLQYQIVGDLTEVDQAEVKIADSNGQVVFSAPVPIQHQGEVVWPAGQLLKVPPKAISIRVSNPSSPDSLPFDGLAEHTDADAPTPVISSVFPNRVEVASSTKTVTVSGRNFLPSTTARIIKPDGTTSDLLPVKFVNTGTVTLDLSSAYFAQLGPDQLILFNLFRSSEPVDITVVPAGLPPAPVLDNVDPTQLSSSASPVDTWITLNGSNFSATDSVVRNDHSEEDFATQFISPNQLKILLPAIWFTEPSATKFHVESATDPGLRSADVELDIDNAVGISFVGPSLGPEPPIVFSINDGYIPLQLPGQAPSTVEVRGSGFESGAQLLVSVDGKQDVPVPPVIVTPVDLKAVLPPDLWKDVQYKAYLVITPKRGPLVTGVEFKIPTDRVTFGELSDKERPPALAQKKINVHCMAFHKRTIDPNPEEYFLSVPIASADGSNTKAKIPEKYVNGTGQQVDFVLDDSRAVTVTPTQTSSKEQVLNLMSISTQAELTTLRAVKKQSGNTGPATSIGILGVQTMPQRNITVYVHFVNTQDGKHKPVTTPSQKDLDKFVTNLEDRLNRIWQTQANVHFSLSPPVTPVGSKTFVETVDYDTDGDGKLAKAPDADSGDITKDNEVTKIIKGIHKASLTDKTAIDLYFVQAITDPTAVVPANVTVTIRGYTFSIGTPPRQVFVSDISLEDKRIHVIAHEIGHALGLTHNSEVDQTDPARKKLFNTANPFITKDKDTDYKDNTSLMWWESKDDGCHIGVPHWFQLNTAN